MLLGDLLKSASKNYQKIFVKGISFDSRKAKKNDMVKIKIDGLGELNSII